MGDDTKKFPISICPLPLPPGRGSGLRCRNVNAGHLEDSVSQSHLCQTSRPHTGMEETEREDVFLSAREEQSARAVTVNSVYEERTRNTDAKTSGLKDSSESYPGIDQAPVHCENI